MSVLLPDSCEYSQATQTQTQATQPTQTPTSFFPADLWGVLVSCAGATTQMDLGTTASDLNRIGGGGGPSAEASAVVEPFVERPSRVEFVLSQNEYHIGRHPKNEVHLGGKKISSKHAKIFRIPGEEGVRLKDLSTNGTFVAGQKIGKNKVTLLATGDEIIFGPPSSAFVNDFRYIFQSPTVANINVGAASESGIHALYDVREQIGKGSFATVRRGIERKTGRMVAIKIIQKARFASSPGTLRLIAREVEIMKSLDHRYCIQYIDYFEDDQRMWLVLEYSGGGDLLDYVMKRRGLSEEETRDIALMVCEGVAYLHSKGIAHRDIKPENLLLSAEVRPVCKIVDFGLAKMASDQTMLKTMCGTPTYLAPEVIINPNATGSYAVSVDAWSIGVVLYSCLTCAIPFDESEDTPLPQRVAERKIDFNEVRKTGCSEIGIDFLSRLLTVDPSKRMSVRDALSHPWLTIASESTTPSLSVPMSVLSSTVSATTSITSPALSIQGSFGYSQQLDNLSLNTPRRKSHLEQSSMLIDDEILARESLNPALVQDSSLLVDNKNTATPLPLNAETDNIVPLLSPSKINGIKRKLPLTSAFSFSSLSSLEPLISSAVLPTDAAPTVPSSVRPTARSVSPANSTTTTATGTEGSVNRRRRTRARTSESPVSATRSSRRRMASADTSAELDRESETDVAATRRSTRTSKGRRERGEETPSPQILRSSRSAALVCAEKDDRIIRPKRKVARLT